MYDYNSHNKCLQIFHCTATCGAVCNNKTVLPLPSKVYNCIAAVTINFTNKTIRLTKKYVSTVKQNQKGHKSMFSTNRSSGANSISEFGLRVYSTRYTEHNKDKY